MVKTVLDRVYEQIDWKEAEQQVSDRDKKAYILNTIYEHYNICEELSEGAKRKKAEREIANDNDIQLELQGATLEMLVERGLREFKSKQHMKCKPKRMLSDEDVEAIRRIDPFSSDLRKHLQVCDGIEFHTDVMSMDIRLVACKEEEKGKLICKTVPVDGKTLDEMRRIVNNEGAINISGWYSSPPITEGTYTRARKEFKGGY